MNHTPLVAVLGPTNVPRVARAADVDPSLVFDIARDVGALIARRGWGMLVVPDRGVAVAAMDGYLGAGGAKLVGLTPTSGDCDPAAALAISSQRNRCHVIEDDLSWYEQHHRIGHRADAMVAVGLSCGTVAELVWTKWLTNPPRVASVREASSALPAELGAELRVDSIGKAELDSWLDATTRKAA